MSFITSRTALVVPPYLSAFIELRCYFPMIRVAEFPTALTEAITHMDAFNGAPVDRSTITLSANRAGSHFTAYLRRPAEEALYARLKAQGWREAKY